MADRYWVGGTGTWDDSSTTHWSTLSGGSGGASVPADTDDVYFDSSSNATDYTVTIADSLNLYCQNLSINAPASGKVTISAGTGTTLFHKGNFLLVGGTAGITWTVSSDFSTKSTANCNFNTYGISLGTTIVQSLTATTFNLISTLNCHALFFQNGSFKSNDYDITLAGYAYFDSLDILNLGNSILTISGTDTAYNETGTVTTSTTDQAKLYFINTSNSDVIVTISNNVTQNYHTIWFNRSASTGLNQIITIGTLNTFKIKDIGTEAHNLKFSDGETYSTNFFAVKGHASKLITITTVSATTSFNLTLVGGGKVITDYLNIQHCIATPANYTWYAGTHSTNNQGVSPTGSGWIFTNPPNSPLPTFFQSELS